MIRTQALGIGQERHDAVSIQHGEAHPSLDRKYEQVGKGNRASMPAENKLATVPGAVAGPAHSSRRREQLGVEAAGRAQLPNGWEGDYSLSRRSIFFIQGSG